MMDSFLFLTHRENKTSITRRKLKPKLQVDGDSFFLEKRPFTTYIGRHANPYAYRSLNNAEQELNNTIGDQKSTYALRNVKQFTKKHNQKVMVDEGFHPNSTILSHESGKKSQSQPRSIRQMKICQMSYPIHYKLEEVVGEPFFVNAKQKLARMIARKKDFQLKFQTMELHVKQVQKERLVARRLKDKEFKNPQPVLNAQWDRQWQKDYKKEVNRYRTRLSVKHKKQNSNLTVEW